MTTTTTTTTTTTGGRIQPLGYIAIVALAIQFGLQPMIIQEFIDDRTNKLILVLLTEGTKICVCILFLLLQGFGTIKNIFKDYHITDTLKYAGIPSIIYTVQSYLMQGSTQHLDPLTFNLLNQTKTIWAALCVWIYLGKKQSIQQIFSLMLLLAAAIILNLPTDTTTTTTTSTNNSNNSNNIIELPTVSSFYYGVLPLLTACFFSGVGAALTQKALQGQQRNSYFYSLELAVCGCSVIIVTIISQSPNNIDVIDMFQYFNFFSLIPILSNALGGIFIGLVVKYAGSVEKGFSLISGIIITTLVQCYRDSSSMTPNQCIGCILVLLSMGIYTAYPYKAPEKKIKDM